MKVGCYLLWLKVFLYDMGFLECVGYVEWVSLFEKKVFWLIDFEVEIVFYFFMIFIYKGDEVWMFFLFFLF